jgi:hypothetical protein
MIRYTYFITFFTKTKNTKVFLTILFSKNLKNQFVLCLILIIHYKLNIVTSAKTMQRHKSICLSSRKLYTNPPSQSKNVTKLSLKELSLSFYNNKTKKNKKQVFCDF